MVGYILCDIACRRFIYPIFLPEKYPVENIRPEGDVPLARLYACVVYIPPIIFPQLYPARPFRPKNIRRKYPVEKRRAVGASLRVGDLYIPHLHAVDLYTTYYIHPEKYPPRKYPPRVETRHSARLQYPRKTCRRFIYPTFACR